MKKHYNLYYLFLEDKQKHPMPEEKVKKIKNFLKTIKPVTLSKPLIITTSETLGKKERKLKDMKRTTTMILVLLVALSLCACGAKKSDDVIADPPVLESQQIEIPQEQETTQPAAPTIPNLEMFVGKWNIVQGDFLDATGFEIKADGTLEMNGETLTWSAAKAAPTSQYEMLLEVEYVSNPNLPNGFPQNAFTLYLERTPEDTFVADAKENDRGSGTQFYREADYRLVEINDSNAMQYLEQVPETNVLEKRGNRYQLIRSGEVKLRDDLGAPSYCGGDLIFDRTYVAVWLTENADDYIMGEEFPEAADQQCLTYNVNMVYPLEYTYTCYWFDNPGSKDLQKEGVMECKSLVGTQDISGYAFIPV